MHYKTPKIKKINLDEKIMSKRAHGMLEIIKNILPHKFSGIPDEYWTNYNQKNKLRQYANELWAKIAKNPQNRCFLPKYDGFCFDNLLQT